MEKAGTIGRSATVSVVASYQLGRTKWGFMYEVEHDGSRAAKQAFCGNQGHRGHSVEVS